MFKITSIIAALFLCVGTYASDKGYNPASLKENASSLVDKEITVSGTVTHVCHSGKKVFIAGDDKTNTIQVFVGGNVTSFDKSVKDSKLVVKGVLKEHRMSKDSIEKSEKETEEKAHGEEDCNNLEKCHSVLKNIKDMKDWMATNQKDYYPIYFVESIETTFN